MRTIVVAAIILSACAVQEVSGGLLRGGADLAQPSLFTGEFDPMVSPGETRKEHDAYADRERTYEKRQEDILISQNAVSQAKKLRKMENAVIKEQEEQRVQTKAQLLVDQKEREAFQKLDKDEQEERDIEKKEDERSAKIRDESDKENSNVKEDVEFNRFPKKYDTKQGKVKSKTEVKVEDAKVVKSQKFYHVDPNKHNEPDQEPHFEDSLRGDDKELSDMFFEEGRPDKARENVAGHGETYMPGLQ